jgi:hypothetical protein
VLALVFHRRDIAGCVKGMANIEIVHPYGHLGPLPWQSTNGFAFGGIAGRKIIQINELKPSMNSFRMQMIWRL